MDLKKIISELRLERKRTSDAIRPLKRPNRFATRTTKAASHSVTEIRGIGNPSATTMSERNRNQQALALLNRFMDAPARRVIEIRPAKEPDDAA